MDNKDNQQVNDWQLLSGFFQYIRPHRKWILFSLLAIPFTTSATVLIPLLIVHIVDDYIVVGDVAGLYRMAVLFAGAVLLGYIADGVYGFSLQKVGQLAIAHMRRALFSHTLTLPRSYFDRKPIGVILSRLTSDMEAMGESLAVGALSLVTDLVKTVALFCFLMYLSWKLTLLIFLVIPIVYLVVSILRKKMRLYFNAAREVLAEATAFLQESLNGIKTIQLYVAESKVVKQFEQKNRRFLEAQKKTNAYDASLFSIIEGLTSVTMALIIWYGTGQILSGFITIGILIGFINTLNKIFIPIREFTQQIASIQRSLAALEHIDELFAEKPEETGSLHSNDLKRRLGTFDELRFDNVSFKYTRKGARVLENVSFCLKKGKRIAIVGATGAGKSTILKLLTKTYGNYEGSITLNGVELSSIPKKLLIETVTMMQQDVYLFNESLAFNISLDRDGITGEMVEKAAEYVNARDFIEELPGKMEYQIIDNGSNLSAGQAQLISFARAIAGKSDLVLLDEATSSVDSVTENLIQKAIEKILRDKTVIAIAHRLSTIQKSDTILVMQDGRIVEQGNHESLLRNDGYYVQLLNKLETEAV
ncbi:MAG: ABC transporter ATP-binding protein [Proteobacteria bacterium]|nr:ABC transporter ATP-binding protein [Pseudomonadota bacterium]